MTPVSDFGLNREDLRKIRRTLHRMPEIGLEEVRTSDYVAARLSHLGYDVHRGLAGTGVVGTMRNGASGRAVGIRAEMDGLPMTESTGLPWASDTPGKMHACGHDGHMAMVLGAAEAIAGRLRFNGTVHLIFQPAEENVGGGKRMVEDGLFDHFPCDAVFALHNTDFIPEGFIALKDGPIMAAVDEARITIRGTGGHGAAPEQTSDPVVAGSGLVMALQTVVSRNVPPHDPAVVTVGAFCSGTVSNIIPAEAKLALTIRSVSPETRALMQKRITDISRLQAESHGCTAQVEYNPSYDATVNHKTETAFVRRMGIEYAGADRVVEMDRPVMGSEDFGYMLQACPGCLFFIGTGREDGSIHPLHHPAYDFNDDILTVGAGFWVYLAEHFLKG